MAALKCQNVEWHPTYLNQDKILQLETRNFASKTKLEGLNIFQGKKCYYKSQALFRFIAL